MVEDQVTRAEPHFELQRLGQIDAKLHSKEWPSNFLQAETLFSQRSQQCPTR